MVDVCENLSLFNAGLSRCVVLCCVLSPLGVDAVVRSGVGFGVCLSQHLV